MDEEDDYYDEDDPDRAFKKQLDDFEVTGLDKFLARVTPMLFQILEANAKSHIFDNYDVAWDDEVEETVMIHKLDTDFDFVDANTATQKTLQKLKESEKATSKNRDDDFDDDFNDYK
jgi:hypothetical protein